MAAKIWHFNACAYNNIAGSAGAINAQAHSV
jgi:hypothetical protein